MNGHGDVRAVLDGVRRIVQSLRESSRWAEKHLGMTGALDSADGEPAMFFEERASNRHRRSLAHA